MMTLHPSPPQHRPATRRRCGTSLFRQAHAGSSLIEVLVAILVLSIGLLGVAGLAAASLRYSQGGWARASVASGLSDLADRVRTNPGADTTAYEFDKTKPGTKYTYADQRADLESGQVTISTDCMADGTACDATELAAFHMTEWRLAMDRNMPGSAVWVSGQRDEGYQATLMWFDKSFVQSDGTTLDTSATCTAAMTGVAARQCCPADAAVSAGVRCTNMTIVP
jgi:type IV pilus assembly protein PilV